MSTAARRVVGEGVLYEDQSARHYVDTGTGRRYMGGLLRALEGRRVRVVETILGDGRRRLVIEERGGS